MSNRDSFIFYKSYYEVSKILTDDERLDFYEKVFEFAFNQNETKTEPKIEALFSFIKPQLEANHRRYENGKKGADHGNKGGRPSGKTPLKDRFSNIVPESLEANQHFIYLIHDTKRNLYKIGETSNLIKRRYSIKEPTENLTIFCFGIETPYNCQQLEKEILREYNGYIYSGDWLSITESQANEISQYIRNKTPTGVGNETPNETPNVNVNVNVNGNDNIYKEKAPTILGDDENGRKDSGSDSRGIIRSDENLFGQLEKPKAKTCRLWQEFPEVRTEAQFANSIPDSWISYAIERGFTQIRSRQVAQEFWHYWVGDKPGQSVNAPRPTKANWYQTWQSWVRNAESRGFKGQPDSSTGESMLERAHRLAATLD